MFSARLCRKLFRNLTTVHQLQHFHLGPKIRFHSANSIPMDFYHLSKISDIGEYVLGLKFVIYGECTFLLYLFGVILVSKDFPHNDVSNFSVMAVIDFSEKY